MGQVRKKKSKKRAKKPTGKSVRKSVRKARKGGQAKAKRKPSSQPKAKAKKRAPKRARRTARKSTKKKSIRSKASRSKTKKTRLKGRGKSGQKNRRKPRAELRRKKTSRAKPRSPKKRVKAKQQKKRRVKKKQVKTKAKVRARRQTRALVPLVPIITSSSQPEVLSAQVPPPIPLHAVYQNDLVTTDILKPHDKLKQSIEAFLLDQRSPHTREAYGKDLRRFIKYLHGRGVDRGVESLDRMVLIGYKEFLLSEKLEHTTVDRHIATLKSFFQWLVDDGLIFKSPADGIRFLNPKRLSTTLGFTDEEVKRVLTLPDLHTRTGALHYAILMVLFYCGLRRSELCSLRTTNLGVEREQRVFRLRGKGNAERILVIVPPVWSAIKHYFYITQRSLATEDYLFKPLRNNRTGIVNKPLDGSMIFYIVTKYARAAGVANKVSPHSCRATAISNARDHDVPDRAIQEFAGWASPDMITRYDKRKTAVENSAAHAIRYGAEDRSIPNHLPSQLNAEIPPNKSANKPETSSEIENEKVDRKREEILPV